MCYECARKKNESSQWLLEKPITVLDLLHFVRLYKGQQAVPKAILVYFGLCQEFKKI